MKKLISLIVLICICGLNLQAQEKASKTRFFEGIVAEEIDGDLDKAIAIYQEVLKSDKTDRQLAAKCLYHLGVCHDKKESGKAMDFFVDLLEKYPDQADMANLARNQITKLEDENTFIDPRDGHKYKWVKIGNQIWMAENLAYMPWVNPPRKQALGIWVYDYEGEDVAEAKATANYQKYGCLYDWPTAMELGPEYLEKEWGGDPENHQGLCPPGWRMPSDKDWMELESFLGMPDSVLTLDGGNRAGQDDLSYMSYDYPPVGSYLKASTDWISGSYGNNITGFNAQPSGCRWIGISNGKTFDTMGEYVNFHCTNENIYGYRDETFYESYGRDFYKQKPSDIGRDLYVNRAQGSSIRCVKNYSDQVPKDYRSSRIKKSDLISLLKYPVEVVQPINNWNQWFGNMNHCGFVNKELPRKKPTLKKALTSIIYASTYPVEGDNCFYYIINDSTIGKYSNNAVQTFWSTDEKLYSGTPVYSQNNLIFQLKDRSIICLDTKLREIRWRRKIKDHEDRMFAAFMMANDQSIFVGGSDSCLYSVDMKTGQINWKFKSNNRLHPCPVASESTVYFTDFIQKNRFDNKQTKPFLYAIDIESGLEKWKVSLEGTIFSSPVLTDSTIILGGGDEYLYAFDCKTGKKKWSFYAYGTVWDCPTVAHGKVFFQSKGGYFFAVDMATGIEIWRFKFGSLQGGYFHPLVGNGEVVFGSQDSCFYALDSNSGNLLWKFPIEGKGGINAAWINNQLIFRVPDKILIVE